jgi:tetrahydromethanopterin S-methyltransferase subunit C
MHSASQNPKVLKSGFVLKCCFAIEAALLNTVAIVWLPLSVHNLQKYSVSCGVPSLGRSVSITGITIFFFTAPAVL